MRLKRILYLLIVILLQPVFGAESTHILHDKCINDLYFDAKEYFSLNTDFLVSRDPRGIVLTCNISNPCREYGKISPNIYKNIVFAEVFLAKIKNPAIIEVHTNDVSCQGIDNLKNWEISTVIANNLESIVLSPKGKLNRERINSVGYGEFLPAKNTPNNGSKYLNRIDIIILCNVSGE